MSTELTTKPTAEQKVELFCLELLNNGFNQKAAYLAVISPKAKSPGSAATRYAQRPEVRQRLSAIVKEAMERHNSSLDKVIGELAAIAHFNPDDFSDLSGDRPRLDLEKLMKNPIAMRATKLKFKRVIDKDGGAHDVYELEQHDKLAALGKLLDYHRSDVDPGDKTQKIVINVGFPVPGSQWSQRSDDIDGDVIDADDG